MVKVNDLKVNIKKTNILQLSNYNSIKLLLTIKYNIEVIEAVQEIKYLGNIFDKHWNWKSHVDL